MIAPECIAHTNLSSIKYILKTIFTGCKHYHLKKKFRRCKINRERISLFIFIPDILVDCMHKSADDLYIFI